VQERVYLLKVRLCQFLNCSDAIVDHCGQLSSLISVLLGVEIEFVKQDFADFDDLLVTQLEVLVCHRHLEVRID